MLQRVPSYIAAVLTVATAIAAGRAGAADLHIYASPTAAASLEYNPLAGAGLLPVAYLAYDTALAASTSNVCTDIHYVGGGDTSAQVDSVAEIAAYGSDTSIDGAAHPGLLGTGVEPMLDASVHLHLARLSTCVLEETRQYGVDLHYALGMAEAYGYGSIDYRIVARAFPPELAGTLDPLRDIPVRLHYALSATIDPESPGGPDRSEPTASAMFKLSFQGGDLITKRVDAPQPEMHGVLSTVLSRTTVDEEYRYTLFISASATGMTAIYSPNGSATADAQAVADPYLEVDPTWAYAPYFFVQVESVANPGAWVEVTRKWQLDTDGDGIPDSLDDCINVANANQRDTDADGFGNVCDPDFNNDGVVNINDFNRLKARLGITPVVDVHVDLDGNGAVNINDLNRLKSFLGKAPGPSGLAP